MGFKIGEEMSSKGAGGRPAVWVLGSGVTVVSPALDGGNGRAGGWITCLGHCLDVLVVGMEVGLERRSIGAGGGFEWHRGGATQVGVRGVTWQWRCVWGFGRGCSSVEEEVWCVGVFCLVFFCCRDKWTLTKVCCWRSCVWGLH